MTRPPRHAARRALVSGPGRAGPVTAVSPIGRTGRVEHATQRDSTRRSLSMAFKRREVLVGTLLVLLCTAWAAAESVEFTECESINPNGLEPIERNCTVNALRIDPCPEASEQKPCKIKKGLFAGISVDFTTTAGSDDMSSRAYWKSVLDLPLVGMDTNACNYTTCPIQPGVMQTYNYNLEMKNYFPTRAYDVKWKLWSDTFECCFITAIKLIR